MVEPSKALAMNLISPMKWWSRIWKALTFWALLTLPFLKPKLDALVKLSFIHFARWVIIPRGKLPRLDPRQPREKLRYDYLLFCSNFNGDWAQYLDAFSDVLSSGLNEMWGGCLNWEDAKYVARLKRYVRWHQIRRGFEPTNYFYCAYPQASTTDIKAALNLYEELRHFQRRCAHLSPPEFAAQYTLFLNHIQKSLGSTGPATVDAGVLAGQAGIADLATPPPFSSPGLLPESLPPPAAAAPAA